MLAQKLACPLAALLKHTRTSHDLAAKMVATLSVVSLLLLPAAAIAQQSYVVGNDRGGYLHDRLIELKNLEQNKVRVEIRGRVCYSTCTMFLGLPDACVSPDTIFGFHGPSSSGRRLAQKDFDYFSRVMAAYYPKPLQDWFMSEGRNRISGVYKVKGSQIIAMGVSDCSTT
ncbi:hypothetical protein [Pelagibacterium sp.]|uniref:hypothetical protein n=1 Tax=Pelagibacterium sp. TaxID=1967288 RepID=UPI003A92BA65